MAAAAAATEEAAAHGTWTPFVAEAGSGKEVRSEDEAARRRLRGGRRWEGTGRRWEEGGLGGVGPARWRERAAVAMAAATAARLAKGGGGVPAGVALALGVSPAAVLAMDELR